MTKMMPALIMMMMINAIHSMIRLNKGTVDNERLIMIMMMMILMIIMMMIVKMMSKVFS